MFSIGVLRPDRSGSIEDISDTENGGVTGVPKPPLPELPPEVLDALLLLSASLSSATVKSDRARSP